MVKTNNFFLNELIKEFIIFYFLFFDVIVLFKHRKRMFKATL